MFRFVRFGHWYGIARVVYPLSVLEIVSEKYEKIISDMFYCSDYIEGYIRGREGLLSCYLSHNACSSINERLDQTDRWDGSGHKATTDDRRRRRSVRVSQLWFEVRPRTRHVSDLWIGRNRSLRVLSELPVTNPLAVGIRPYTPPSGVDYSGQLRVAVATSHGDEAIRLGGEESV